MWTSPLLAAMLTCLLLVAVSVVSADGIDDKMRDLATDFGDSLTSISSAHNHKVDWMFVVDHGGYREAELHLEYSKYFIQEMAKHLYISPMHSQAGVVTYGAATSIQIPFDIQNGNQCDFNRRVNKLTLTPGKSDMNKALDNALKQLQNHGRRDAHKVTVLITTAGWENVGTNPYANVAKVKNIGTLMVVVMVFNKAESIVSPVILSFASDRSLSGKIAGSALSKKYAFEMEAKRGNLRRLYRHFLLATEKMDYLPLQVPAGYCTTSCQTVETCVCDTNLYSTYHCEADTYAPMITIGCPANIRADTEPGQPSATVHWLTPAALDYSSSMQSEVLTPELSPPHTTMSTLATLTNLTHTTYNSFIGTTEITQRFYDAAGNSINCSFTVTVVDVESPKITNCPQSPVSDNATMLMSTKLVTWPVVTATDNSLEDPEMTLYINGVQRPLETRYFPIGSSNVTLEFTDGSDNFATCRFAVIVRDHEPPVPQQCTGPNSTIFSSDVQAYVDWIEPTFVDNSGLAVRITGDTARGYFRIGQHTVTYAATDVFGNIGKCSFTFTVRGYPCPTLPAPYNGAIVCDNAVPGATCQIFCQNPFDLENIPGNPKLPEKFSCVGKGVWWPTDKVPHCVVMQEFYKKLPQSYYYDGNCSDFNVSKTMKDNAVGHYNGFVEGRYFREAWGREISAKDFNNPVCGAEAAITTSTSTTAAPTTNALPTTPVRRTVPRATVTLPAAATSSPPRRTIPTATPTTARPRIGGTVIKTADGVNVIGK